MYVQNGGATKKEKIFAIRATFTKLIYTCISDFFFTFTFFILHPILTLYTTAYSHALRTAALSCYTIQRNSTIGRRNSSGINSSYVATIRKLCMVLIISCRTADISSWPRIW